MAISQSYNDIYPLSGLRGAIAFALALHLPFDEETKKVIVSTTLVIVLFTIIVMGGATMPVTKVRYQGYQGYQYKVRFYNTLN